MAKRGQSIPTRPLPPPMLRPPLSLTPIEPVIVREKSEVEKTPEKEEEKPPKYEEPPKRRKFLPIPTRNRWQVSTTTQIFANRNVQKHLKHK